jgi:hypothetical protein
MTGKLQALWLHGMRKHILVVRMFDTQMGVCADFDSGSWQNVLVVSLLRLVIARPVELLKDLPQCSRH